MVSLPGLPQSASSPVSPEIESSPSLPSIRSLPFAAGQAVVAVEPRTSRSSREGPVTAVSCHLFRRSGDCVLWDTECEGGTRPLWRTAGIFPCRRRRSECPGPGPVTRSPIRRRGRTHRPVDLARRYRPADIGPGGWGRPPGRGTRGDILDAFAADQDIVARAKPPGREPNPSTRRCPREAVSSSAISPRKGRPMSKRPWIRSSNRLPITRSDPAHKQAPVPPSQRSPRSRPDAGKSPRTRWHWRSSGVSISCFPPPGPRSPTESGERPVR